jgi:glyoxylase-like metal-dependent hydrolase (beta-lactamase superfamily II)
MVAMVPKSELPALRRALLRWHRRHALVAPWRTSGDAYQVLVAAVMAQQTQMARVLPKFAEFIGAFPTVEALAGARVSRIIVTHRHADHWASIDALKQATGAPVACHAADREPYASKVDATLADGDEIAAGSLRVRVIHTPGHTPGSVCFLVAHQLLSGDTLFPGGPGRTGRPEDLQEEIRSITSRLFVLPDATLVHPGHGAGTTIGRAKEEYAAFASRAHPPDLCGDVTWEGA